MRFWSKLKVYLRPAKKPTAREIFRARAEERGKVHAAAEAVSGKLIAFARHAVDLKLNDLAQVFLDMSQELSVVRKAVVAELEKWLTAALDDRQALEDKTAEKVAALKNHIELIEAKLRTIPAPGEVRRTTTVEDGRLIRANFKPRRV